MCNVCYIGTHIFKNISRPYFTPKLAVYRMRWIINVGLSLVPNAVHHRTSEVSLHRYTLTKDTVIIPDLYSRDYLVPHAVHHRTAEEVSLHGYTLPKDTVIITLDLYNRV